MPYDLQMEYTTLHIPNKPDLEFHASACAPVPSNGCNYTLRLSQAINSMHETSAPTKIDVMKEAHQFAYNQTNNDDSFMLHTKTQDMLSTTTGNHIPTSSLGSSGVKNGYCNEPSHGLCIDIGNSGSLEGRNSNVYTYNHIPAEEANAQFTNSNTQDSFPRRKNVTNNHIKESQTCIGYRQKQYARRIHRHISDDQRVASLKIVYTIEFQKRGLPHCHSLLWLNESSKIHQDSDVDKYISAELPDPTDDVDGYRVISELMMHGPCGYANSSAACMKDGTSFNRNFPKPYSDRTLLIKTDMFTIDGTKLEST
uniref:DNA helicase n=1 Tax=Tanacetum cinerariifolium TaxID=118510 RepID=A0A699HUK6_TANCI|nr:DNA helicase [Tanacetum cinerariifolium]